MKKLLFLVAAITFLYACKRNPCEILHCKNGGTCDDGACICPWGYTGIDCSVLLKDTYTGTYSVNENVGGSIQSRIYTLFSSPAHHLEVGVVGFGGSQDTILYRFTDESTFGSEKQYDLDANDGQNLLGAAVGWGYLDISHDTITNTITFYSYINNGSFFCTGNGTKQ